MTSNTEPQLPPISFEIATRSSKGFKSIRNLVWKDVPEFAVLTGRNGSGKSQLLLYLAHALNQAMDPQYPELTELQIQTKGATFEPGDVSYVPDSGGLIYNAGVSVGELPNIKKQAYQNIRQSRSHPHIQSRQKYRWATQVFGPDLDSLSEADFIKQAPDDLSFMLDDQNPLHGLAHVFFGYRLQGLAELEKGTPKDEIEKLIGPAPWKVLDEILTVAEFPYRVQAPISSLLNPYEIELKEHNALIKPQDLSSGEKVILQLALWLYLSRHHNRFPKLLLLDEPDAHLHPSMARQFMDVIQEVLVNRYKVRVILTTHSPSTVALAPEGSVFEMTRGSSTIVASSSKANSIGLLTAGLVVVSPTTRFILVEDEADVSFHSAFRDVLADHGPSKDAMALMPTPSMVFLPVSVGRGSNKTGGGRDNVRQWVDRLNVPPFDQIVRGLIDRDTGNTAAARILILNRYSIENYLLDPFVIFGLLIETNAAPKLEGISITSGDEHLVRSLPNEKLQTIVDFIQTQIQPRLSSVSVTDTHVETIEFTNGRSVRYPSWMVERRGHDLLPVFQSAFGGASVISPPRLTKMLQRVRLVPKDIALLLAQLQSG